MTFSLDMSRRKGKGCLRLPIRVTRIRENEIANGIDV
nr:MAG TPA: hypothetical protein [Caudoviricetes sp.]